MWLAVKKTQPTFTSPQTHSSNPPFFYTILKGSLATIPKTYSSLPSSKPKMMDLKRQSMNSSRRVLTAGASGEWSYAADKNASHPFYRTFNTVLSQTQAYMTWLGNGNPMYFISRISEFQTTGYNSTITFEQFSHLLPFAFSTWDNPLEYFGIFLMDLKKKKRFQVKILLWGFF